MPFPTGATWPLHQAGDRQHAGPGAANSLGNTQQTILKNVFPRIKHVLWIIRENRTYDQILGDLPYGNGDPSLAIFGKDVTPNAHALAQEFVLLDNLYCSGEVSEDGHEWCNAAYATDFTEKAWINSYSDRGEPDSDDRLTKSPAGYLWDNCRKNNVTYRSYGEYAAFSSDKNHAPVFHGDKGLEGHTSLAWSVLDGKHDFERVEAFVSELRDAEKTGDWPAYMVMSLGEDHTMGGRANWFTPDACVASNDQALGKIVEAVSRSKFWASTAIFVMEDDAQDGPDHVDAHRTVGFVISPYTRRHAVDSTLYTTVSFVHSMELMLKLEPMTQYDSSAMPVFNAMTEQADFSPFTVVPAPSTWRRKTKQPALMPRRRLSSIFPVTTDVIRRFSIVFCGIYASPANFCRHQYAAYIGPSKPNRPTSRR